MDHHALNSNGLLDMDEHDDDFLSNVRILRLQTLVRQCLARPVLLWDDAEAPKRQTAVVFMVCKVECHKCVCASTRGALSCASCRQLVCALLKHVRFLNCCTAQGCNTKLDYFPKSSLGRI